MLVTKVVETEVEEKVLDELLENSLDELLEVEEEKIELVIELDESELELELELELLGLGLVVGLELEDDTLHVLCVGVIMVELVKAAVGIVDVAIQLHALLTWLTRDLVQARVA